MIHLLLKKDINDKLIKPDFIYNRFDLFNFDKTILLFSDESQHYIEVLIGKISAYLGIWMTEISHEEILNFCDYIFCHYSRIMYVGFSNAIVEGYENSNHFYVNLPKTIEELQLKLSSKSRYNLRRECTTVKNIFQKIEFIEYTDIPLEIIEKYFELKKLTHHIDYYMSVQDYLFKYHVTNAYTLTFDNHIVSILLTCEQCPCVYLENLTYDISYAKLSPGKIAYDFLLKNLIQKGKIALFLAGGNYEYKKRYGSIENNVFSDVIFRNNFVRFIFYLKYIPNRIRWKLKTCGFLR